MLGQSSIGRTALAGFPLVPSGAVTVALAGSLATFSTGTMTAGVDGTISVALTGSQSTFSAGTLSPDVGSSSISVALTGNAVTFSIGTVSSSLFTRSGNVFIVPEI